jgi:hypothetical protein
MLQKSPTGLVLGGFLDNYLSDNTSMINLHADQR